MNLKISINLFITLIALNSCDNSLETDKRVAEEKSIESYLSTKKWQYTKADGVYHVAQNTSYGYEVNIGDTIIFWYKGYTIGSSTIVFDTNIKSVAAEAKMDTIVRKFEPIFAVMGKTDLLKGLYYGLRLCREGQKATILFPSNLGYKDNYMGSVPAWSPLAFDVEIIYLNGQGKISEQNILNNLNLDEYTQHSSGLFYKYVVDTGSIKPLEIDSIWCSYNISLINGSTVEEFQTNQKPIAIKSLNIDALKIGFSLTSTGGTTKIISPSPLAYGKKGNEMVPSYTPVEITIKLDSIKKN